MNDAPRMVSSPDDLPSDFGRGLSAPTGKPPTLSAALELSEVRALVNAMRAAKGYLEKGHDGMAMNIIRSALVPFEGKGE